MKYLKYIFLFSFLLSVAVMQNGCNFVTHRTLSNGTVTDPENDDPEPDYNVSLDPNYQDFTSYLFLGNRIENFTAYFNKFFIASEDYETAMEEYRTALITEYSRRLDSLAITPPVSASVKDKLNKSIERASKIIQFHKNSKYIDQAVLLIGKSYYYMGDYFNAERKFDEFLSKLSSSQLADEAILFLGRTRIKLGKYDEGKNILSELAKNSSDKEIKSLATRDLGILLFNKGNIEDAINDFKASIEFTNSKERKAEGQFILAKVLSQYNPSLSAKEYSKVTDYTSDFDLSFFARLNAAKGMIFNKSFISADETLADLRKKYRDVPSFTQLVDLEIANSLYGQNKIKDAKNKYFEIIVKYAGSVSAADAYYYLGKHEEEKNDNYLYALVNYKKAESENASSEFHNESSVKAATLDRYFYLLGEVKDTASIKIPTSNAEVEKYRSIYNEEKGIEQIKTEENDNGNTKDQDDGRQKGNGKGRAGGFKSISVLFPDDSLKDNKIPETGPSSDPTMNNPGRGRIENNSQKNNKKDNDTTENKGNEVTSSVNNDSLNALADSIKQKQKEIRTFSAYYELAEIFIYSLGRADSAEKYLNILLSEFNAPEYKSKVLYTLANFYKNNDRKSEADETFGRIISDYPNTVYAFASKNVLGINASESEITQKPADEIFLRAFNFYNEKKYTEAINALNEIEVKFPDDSVVAKSLYGIGFVYENGFLNKDSSVAYYSKLAQKYPQSVYTEKIIPKLDYIKSLEVKDTVSTDSVKTIVSDSTNTGIENIKNEEIKEGEVKDENQEQALPDSTKSGDEKNLTPEEIEKLLKENEENNPAK
ncbi:MAG: tetratricopeptide repeat protein [Ignavibacteria bacterium]|nr:tetratricopeptide repeat protein [Ignavibacteria bacterium]